MFSTTLLETTNMFRTFASGKLQMHGFLLIALAATVACGKDSPAAPPKTVTGTWIGSSNGMSISMTISHSATTVTGTGQANGPSGSVALQISGTFVEPTASLTMTAQGYEPMNYSGSLNQPGNQLVGSINGSGFTNTPFVFTRQ